MFDRYASCKRLRNGIHQKKILRTGQDILPRCTCFIDLPLKVGKKFWYTLNLIKYNVVRMKHQKRTRVILSKSTNVWIFQQHIGIVRKFVPQ